MTTLRVHFDGRVLVPDGPVDLPRNRPLEIDVREVIEADEKGSQDLGIERHPKSGMPVFKILPGSKPLTLEDVRRAEEDE